MADMVEAVDMGKTIKISKADMGDAVCRIADVKELTPNTEITVADGGVTVFVTVNGVTRALTAGSATVYSLFNSDKDKKLFGGNKAYGSSEVFAVDRAHEFVAQWGFGKAEAVPCKNAELGVDCAAVVTGKYTYTIKDCIGFKNAIGLKSGALYSGELREILREKTSGSLRAYFAKTLGACEFKKCKTRIGEFCEELKQVLNGCLDNYGIEVDSVEIESMESFIMEYGDRRDEITEKTIDNAVNKLVNDGRKDDISVDAMKASKVDIPLIYANNAGKKSGKTFNCPKCGQALEQGSNYCVRCGEKFLNKD